VHRVEWKKIASQSRPSRVATVCARGRRRRTHGVDPHAREEDETIFGVLHP
jgi:hypothetical protein